MKFVIFEFEMQRWDLDNIIEGSHLRSGPVVDAEVHVQIVSRIGRQEPIEEDWDLPTNQEPHDVGAAVEQLAVPPTYLLTSANIKAPGEYVMSW